MKLEKIERDESWLLDENAEVAVPLEVCFDGETAEALYYPSAESVFDELVRLFGDALFSEEAIKWACDGFGEILSRYGFVLSPDSEDYYNVYALSADGFDAVNGIVRLDGNEGYTDLTETDIKGLSEDGYVLYGAVADGKIVAIANTCEPVGDTACEVEVGVDTASEYRRMGYGRACVGALIRELCERGHTPVYECASKNTASAALAKSFDGRIIRKKIYIVGFRDE